MAQSLPEATASFENAPSAGPPPSSASFLARTSVLLAVATLLSRVLGFVREMLIAHYYGSTGGTDSLFFSLNIAEAIRTIIISGAIASVFIPLMTETQRSGKTEEARKLAWVMLAFVSVLATIVVLLAESLAPWIVKLTEAISFTGKPLDPARIETTVNLMRIMLPVILMVSLWGLMGGILNALDNFWVPGLAPLIWNMTIITVPILYGDREQVRDIAWAYVVGHFLQMVVHLPWLWKAGIRPSPIDWRHPMLRRFLVMAPAAIFAYAAPAVNSFIGQGIALNLGESASSHLAYAIRTQQLPLAVFGVSVATAIFPTLSRHAAAGDKKALMSTLAAGMRMTTLAMLPAAIFFMALPVDTIRLLFERGRFHANDTVAVAQALYYYSLGVVPSGLLLLTARTFFSEKDMRTPALIGLASIFVYYALCVSITRYVGFVGIASGFSIVVWLTLFVSMAIISRRYKKEASLLHEIGLKSIVLMLVAGAFEAAALLMMKHFIGPVQGTLHMILLVGGSMVLATFVYIGALTLMGSTDLKATVRNIARRR